MSESVEPYVRLTRLIRAPRASVYQAWLDPALRAKWSCPYPNLTPGEIRIDATVGGRYRVGMKDGDREFVAYGEFVELNPPSRMVFTWSWEHQPDFGADSKVTIDLFEAEFEGRPATEIVLLHERLATPLERSDHTTGWLLSLKNLGGYFAALDHEKAD